MCMCDVVDDQGVRLQGGRGRGVCILQFVCFLQTTRQKVVSPNVSVKAAWPTWCGADHDGAGQEN